MKRIVTRLVSVVLGLAAITAGATPPDGVGGGRKCYLQLFDGDSFQGDPDDTVYGPGRFANLRNLPGTRESDWGGEVDSLRVGSAATVQVWAQENFGGAPQTYGPGTEQTNAEEFYSMEIACG